MVSFAAGLTALLSGVTFASPQTDVSQPQISVARDGADMMVRISLHDMVAARGAPISGPAADGWRGADISFGGDFARGQSGISNIAVAAGAGSTAQASTSITMNVRIVAGF